MSERSKKDRRHDDPNGMQEYGYERTTDTVTFEVLTDRIHNQSVECNARIADQFEQWSKQFISWRIATSFFAAAVVVVAGATWAICISINDVKNSIPIEKITTNTTFAAEKIKTIETAIMSKTDSINKDAVEKALKIIQVEKQK